MFLCEEIRAAPHMDSLVSIYKSMEVSSGVNIFDTQNVPGAKLLGTFASSFFLLMIVIVRKWF